MDKHVPTKMTDETIRFFIENATDENGAVYADSLYYQVLNYSLNEFSTEYDKGKLKIFYYTGPENEITVNEIECNFENYKTLLDSSEREFKNHIDRLTLSKYVFGLDVAPIIEELDKHDEDESILASLTPREQLQYQAFLMDSYDDSSS